MLAVVKRWIARPDPGRRARRPRLGGVVGSRLPVRVEHLAWIAAVLVVVAVVGVFLGIRGRAPAGSPPEGRGVKLVFSASALDRRSPLGPSIERSIAILRLRLGSAFHGVEVSRAGSNIVIVVPDAPGESRGRIVALAAAGQLEFYDWEANAVTPNGKTVASQLQQARDPNAIAISQGSGVAPGVPGAGSMSLYDAVKLASRQGPEPASDNSRNGPEYYIFGAPGSAACAVAAKKGVTAATPAKHCLLSGPADNRHDLLASLPPGVNASQGQTLVVPQGLVVLRATGASFSQPPIVTDPTAQYFVLRDRVSLLGNDITHPQQSTDVSGGPDVEFGFTSHGANAFHSATSTIAHRGELISRLGQMLDQHFAVALDNELISVPSIDFKTYPDGIAGHTGADITAGFTIQSAQTVATLLRFGALSVNLEPH
jgi:SecD/SecF fusion protein